MPRIYPVTVVIAASFLLAVQGLFFTDKEDAKVPSYGKRNAKVQGLLLQRILEENTNSIRANRGGGIFGKNEDLAVDIALADPVYESDQTASSWIPGMDHLFNELTMATLNIGAND